MARGITQIDVNQAADALLLGGERPTVDRIRQHLGTGSPNTVTRLLDVWWKALGSRLSVQQRKVELPEAPEAVATLASQLWEQALSSARELAEAALGEERGTLAAARLEADARVAAAQQALEAAREAEAQAMGALSRANERLQERQVLVDQQTSQLEDVTHQRDEALHRAASHEAEVGALRGRLEAQQAEAAAFREAQAAHLRAVEDRAHAEIDRARQETREIKYQLRALEKAQSARLRELETQLTEARNGAAQAARELAAEQARRETLEVQQDELRRSLASAIVPARLRKSARARTTANPGNATTGRGAMSKKSK